MKTIDDLLTTGGREIREAAGRVPTPASNYETMTRASTRVVLLMLGAVALFGFIAVAIWSRPPGSDVADPAEPVDFGAWQPIPDAPIAPRPNAVAVWSGSEALFWAGSSLDRGFAYTDGAAFEPVSGTWRMLNVPGWGHPGLSGIFFDGELYALAKGGGTRLDLDTGEWHELPEVEGMFFSAVVATDHGVWGLGPASLNPEGQPDVAIARYEKRQDRWVYGPAYEGSQDVGSVFGAVIPLHQPALWTGTEIVIWNPLGVGIAFHPGTGTWREISRLDPPGGDLISSKAVVVDGRLAVVAATGPERDAALWLVTEVDGDWQYQELEVTLGDLTTTTVASAGDWLALFPPDDFPITVHLPSGIWTRHQGWPVGEVQAPNTVWTGEKLVVWGGVNSTNGEPNSPAQGAIWIPPAGS